MDAGRARVQPRLNGSGVVMDTITDKPRQFGCGEGKSREHGEYEG